MTTRIDVADLDVIYLSYDEPQKEKFWVEIKNIVPWAKRVDGVNGSDAAHKAAAAASETERFILIDGDNLPEDDFFDLILEFPDEQWEQAVYRWRAKNNINGLMYGNGGISSWTRTFINNMKTSVSKFNNHSSLTYITKLLIISSSDAAVLNTTVPAIGFVGEVIKKLDDWIPESKNG